MTGAGSLAGTSRDTASPAIPSRLPRVIAVADASELGSRGADEVERFLEGEATDAARVLGVATGSSPEPVYDELARRRPPVDRLHLVALDEYVGLDSADRRSYRFFVRSRIAEPLGVDPLRVVVPDGSAVDPEQAARDHEEHIARIGPVGLQIGGIGANGHLGFNEPGSPFGAPTRVVALADRTRVDNARYFGGSAAAVPASAITQGLGTIMSAERILLLARGTAKARALRAALTGPVTESVPASILQRHPDVTVIADADALGLL